MHCLHRYHVSTCTILSVQPLYRPNVNSMFNMKAIDRLRLTHTHACRQVDRRTPLALSLPPAVSPSYNQWLQTNKAVILSVWHITDEGQPPHPCDDGGHTVPASPTEDKRREGQSVTCCPQPIQWSPITDALVSNQGLAATSVIEVGPYNYPPE